MGKGVALDCCSPVATFAADEALRIGLVNRVVPAAELMTEARRSPTELAAQGAAGDAVHHRSGEPRPRVSFDKAQFSRRRCSVSWPRPPTCARGRARFSRSGNPRSRESSGRLPGSTDHDDVELQGVATPPAVRFAIVVSRFNEDVTEGCCTGALEALAQADVAGDDITVVRVPGAFEIPLDGAARWPRRRQFDAVMCLGCLIKGDTMHFEYIAAAASQRHHPGVAPTGVPMAFGVLTTLTDEQAMARRPRGRTTRGGKRRWRPSRWRRCSTSASTQEVLG